jgi:hypothetical protein
MGINMKITLYIAGALECFMAGYLVSTGMFLLGGIAFLMGYCINYTGQNLSKVNKEEGGE